MATKKTGNNKNQKNILIVIFSVVAIWAYWNYLLKPVNNDIKSLRSQLLKKQQQLETTRQAAMECYILEAEYKILQLEAAELEKKLPFKKDMPKLISDITKSLDKNRISIQTFTPGPEVTKTYFSEMPISLQVRGSYHNLATFLAEIGQYERIINTYDLNIMPVAPTKFSSDTISASLKLVTYIGK